MSETYSVSTTQFAPTTRRPGAEYALYIQQARVGDNPD